MIRVQFNQNFGKLKMFVSNSVCQAQNLFCYTSLFPSRGTLLCCVVLYCIMFDGLCFFLPKSSFSQVVIFVSCW
jgi:hypothetical protein